MRRALATPALPILLSAALLLPAVLLTGCGAGFDSSPVALPNTASIGVIHGLVHGGSQPVVGSHVYLYAASTGGYGAASTSLLASYSTGSYPTTEDGDGNYYITTDTTGSFSLTGEYTCVSGTQVYLYAIGGNPGSGLNSAAGLLAVLGQCPASGSLASQVPYVTVNEVSTVAAAYALAGFAADATHVGSSGTPLALTGIANAFANAANLASVASGSALATTPAGNGTVPQSTINTLANILVSCVNSTGSGACIPLFGNARSNGQVATLSSSVPTETASAAIFIAQNPGTNVSGLYPLAGTTPPFAPFLAVQPNDFTISLLFTGGGIYIPQTLAVDASGNVWVNNDTQETTGRVSKFSPLGAPLSGSTGFTAGGANGTNIRGEGIAIDTAGNAWIVATGLAVLGPTGTAASGSPYSGCNNADWTSIALDASGDAWLPNGNTNTLCEFSSSGAALSGSSGYSEGLSGPVNIAIDPSGYIWVANEGSQSITQVSLSTLAHSSFTGGGLASGQPFDTAVDASGNIWVANLYGALLSEFSKTGSPVSASGYTGGGYNGGAYLAVDGNGNIWAQSTSLVALAEFSNVGEALSSSTGYVMSHLKDSFGSTGTPQQIAVDGSGDIWMAENNGQDNNVDAVVELIGAAAPVVTPIVAGVANHTLGTRP